MAPNHGTALPDSGARSSGLGELSCCLCSAELACFDELMSQVCALCWMVHEE